MHTKQKRCNKLKISRGKEEKFATCKPFDSRAPLANASMYTGGHTPFRIGGVVCRHQTDNSNISHISTPNKSYTNPQKCKQTEGELFFRLHSFSSRICSIRRAGRWRDSQQTDGQSERYEGVVCLLFTNMVVVKKMLLVLKVYLRSDTDNTAQ